MPKLLNFDLKSKAKIIFKRQTNTEIGRQNLIFYVGIFPFDIYKVTLIKINWGNIITTTLLRYYFPINVITLVR